MFFEKRIFEDILSNSKENFWKVFIAMQTRLWGFWRAGCSDGLVSFCSFVLTQLIIIWKMVNSMASMATLEVRILFQVGLVSKWAAVHARADPTS